jgi:hypothetical protein
VRKLAVTNAVLQHEIPADALSGDLALALEKNEALEIKVQNCADDLESVATLLADEVARHRMLKKKLAEVTGAVTGEVTGEVMEVMEVTAETTEGSVTNPTAGAR